MKIGIILHSQTGNTLAVGKRILESLQTNGHDVTLLRIKNTESVEKPQKLEDVQIDNYPNISDYEALIFGAWVEAFNLCSGFQVYLKQLNKVEANLVLCFVTQHFPYKWMGGYNAVSKMKKSLACLGVTIASTGIINWTNKLREKQIDELVSHFSSQFDHKTAVKSKSIST
jgi:hypothetical protein